jgi:hypothetical protein
LTEPDADHPIVALTIRGVDPVGSDPDPVLWPGGELDEIVARAAMDGVVAHPSVDAIVARPTVAAVVARPV